MGKKILYIVLGALLIFGLLFLLWMWLFSGSSGAPNGTGTFGSAGDTTQTPVGGTNSNNGEVPLDGNGVITVGAGSYNAQGVYVGPGNGTYDANGTYVGTQSTSTGSSAGTVGAGSYNSQGVFVGAGNGTYDAGGNYVGTVSGSGGTTGTGSGSTGTGGTIGTGIVGTSSNVTIGSGNVGIGTTTGLGATTTGFATNNGVLWLGSPFSPADINSVSSGVGGFAPTITSLPANGGGSNALNLGTSLIGAGVGVVACALRAGWIAKAAADAAASIVVVNSANLGSVPVRNFGLDSFVAAGITAQTNLQAGGQATDLAGCFLNVIAKTTLQLITQSVVNWINGGFKGQPSFVSNYQQFFTNVADLAAGQFIQGAGLSFLCSPFKLQIKIAIAQSYANRNAAASCSLTKVISNINGFMNGNFSQGGWGGLVSFTTIPTNNPYGAFAYAQAGLAGAQANALANAKNNISPTGFLNFQQRTCGGSTSVVPSYGIAGNSQAAQTSCPSNCNCKVATPGQMIQDSLTSANDTTFKQLGLANSIDQILTALTNQLVVSMLQNGLTSLSQSTTQTSADLAAQTQALTVLNQMQAETTLAQQLGAIYQGSISDIQSAQASLNGLANCWGFVASTTSDVTASEQAAAATASRQSLDTEVTNYNNDITQVNSAIAVLNQFVSDISTAASAADVTTVSDSYNAAVAAGSFPSQTDVTTAQQNRVTLQSQLVAINQSTQTSLVQCQAAGGH